MLKLLRLLLAIVILVMAGCGPSDQEGLAPFLSKLQKSPSVTLIVHHNGKEYRQQLSPRGRETLYSLIRAAKLDSNPAKYEVLGSIDYQLAEGPSGRAALYHISEVEACLKFDRKYIRGINAIGLRRLAMYPDTETAK